MLRPQSNAKTFTRALASPSSMGRRVTDSIKADTTSRPANNVGCLEKGQRCVVILSNDVRAEAGFADLVKFILGDTGVPYDWECGDYAGKS
jgi:hypothetical protein